MSLLNCVNNPAERIHKTKCKYGHNDKKCQTCAIKFQRLRLLSWTHKQMFMFQQELSGKLWWNLKKRFFNTSKPSNHDINKIFFVGKKWLPL